MENQEYPEFNIRQLAMYEGDNPYIRKFSARYNRGELSTLEDSENEYLLKNLKFSPFTFDTITLEIGPKSEKMVQQTFNTDKPIPKVKINAIVAETDDLYHVRYNSRYFWLKREEVGDIYAQVYATTNIDFEWLNNQFKHSLYDWQERAVEFFLYNRKCFLFDEVGVGKTHSSIAASIAAKCEKILIVCKGGNKINWRNELRKWDQDCKVINGFKGWIEEEKKYTIISFSIIDHYHEKKIRGVPYSDLYRPLIDEGYDCIIVDETHMVKSPKANRSVTLQDICAQSSVEYIFGLTATAVEKSNEDFYNISQCLNISVSNLVYSKGDYHYCKWYPKFEEFKQRYCGAFQMKVKGRTFWRSVKNTNTYELFQRTKFIQLRREQQTTIEGFPEADKMIYWCDLTGAQKQKNQELFDNYLKAKGNQALEDVRSMVEVILMRQYLAKEKAKQTATFVKDEAEMGRTSIIFTHFKEEFNILKKLLGTKCVVVRSGWSAEKKQDAIDEFMTNPKKMYILGNIQTLGTGHNIQRADNVVFNSPDWNSAEHEQGIGRALRLGRVGTVWVYFMIFEGSIEEDVYERAESKSDNKRIFYGKKSNSEN